MSFSLNKLLDQYEDSTIYKNKINNSEKYIPDFNNILLSLFGRVAMITLNRPKQLNALNQSLLIDLERCLYYLESRGDIGCIVLTGTGRAFAAGADINWMAPFTVNKALKYDLINPFHTFANYSLPIIAAVNGFALGGGCEIAMSCDIILASTKAKFGQPEIKLGVIPGGGGTQRLIRFVGKSKAMELILTGKMIGAKEAKEYNLVSAVYNPNELIQETMKLAKKIASMSLPIAKLCKRTILDAENLGLTLGLESERKNFHLCFGHNDQKQGMQAFINKQKPEWTHD